MDNDLTPDQIEQELAELIEGSEVKDSQQESEMLIDVGEYKDTAKKEPKIKKQFTTLSKENFEKLSKREQYEHKIELSKYKTEQLKNEYKSYKSRQTETSRSLETKRLIILGRFLETQFKNEDRKVAYLVVKSHLDRYLTKNSDRLLFGFAPIPKSEG